MSFTSLPRPTIGSASSPPTSSSSPTPDPLVTVTDDITSWASVHNVTLPWYADGASMSGGQKGITTPVKIGLPIVGIVVGLALVGLAVWLFIRYRRRKTRAHRKDTTDNAAGLLQTHGSTSDNKTRC
ncbi:hypothetical protein QBC37DRAFT_406802 [Rhypophila decipiens]|uniref:Uncharacterized protein n=1 Tax=Rhypophila decipiens TaxID=261697 RepID=A0AAN7B1U3_9PEZI|nr:hypothetical protein QBC37DRAFT_406802 [Rhypophila decipiens]